jgi:hypothetical protein
MEKRPAYADHRSPISVPKINPDQRRPKISQPPNVG